MSDEPSFTITPHSAFCPDCGGWEVPKLVEVCPHECQVVCSTCGEVLLLARTVEP